MSDEIENVTNEQPAEEVRGSVNRFPTTKFGTLGQYARKVSGVDTTIYRNVSAAEKSHAYDWLSKQDVKNANERFEENQGLMAELGIDKNKMTRMLADKGVTPDKFGKLHLADQINTANLILKREARKQGYDGTLEVGNISIDLTEDSVESQAIEMKANGHRNKMSNSKAGLRAGMGVGGTAFTVISPIFGAGGGAMLGYKACTSLFGDNALGKTMGVVAGVFGAAGGAVAAPFVAGWATGKAVEHGENPIKQFMNIFKNPKGIFNKLVDGEDSKDTTPAKPESEAKNKDNTPDGKENATGNNKDAGLVDELLVKTYQEKFSAKMNEMSPAQIDKLLEVYNEKSARGDLSAEDRAVLDGFKAALLESAAKINHPINKDAPKTDLFDDLSNKIDSTQSLKVDTAKLNDELVAFKEESGDRSPDEVLAENDDLKGREKQKDETIAAKNAEIATLQEQLKASGAQVLDDAGKEAPASAEKATVANMEVAKQQAEVVKVNGAEYLKDGNQYTISTASIPNTVNKQKTNAVSA